MQSLLEEMHVERRKNLLHELLTKTERVMISKRLMLIFLISRNESTLTISKILSVSPSTVARFEMLVEQGKYRDLILWLGKHRTMKRILQLLEDIASVPFEAHGTSLNQLIKKPRKFIR